MADVNESNVLVTATGEARLIDCDSFQITANGRCFPCPVGVAIWTPPELQGRPFASLVRTEQHDRFGLAVMLFHLLFMGRHPYAGVPRNPAALEHAPPLEDCIRRGQFAYTRRALVPVAAPRHALTLAALPDAVADLFERAFLEVDRPSAADWHRALGAIEFQKCTWGHVFFRRLPDCPWCGIWSAGGPNFFLSLTQVASIGASAAEIERLLAEIRDATGPAIEDQSMSLYAIAPTLTRIPEFTRLPMPEKVPTLFTRDLFADRPVFIAGLVCLCVSALGWAAQPSRWFLWLAMIVAGLWMLREGRRKRALENEFRRRREAESAALQRVASTLKRMNEANDEHRREFDGLRQQCAEDLLEHDARLVAEYERVKVDLLKDLDAVLVRYRNLPREKSAMVDTRRRDAQLEDYLRRHRVDGNRIVQIGPARAAVLARYGIETAWDVKNMGYLPQLGPGDAELRNWLARVEARFRFDPARPLPAAAEQAIARDVQRLEQGVLGDYQEAQRTWQQLRRESDADRLARMQDLRVAMLRRRLIEYNEFAVKRMAALQTRLQEQVEAYAQARADASICPPLSAP
jgi:DNA-binding helix-hairpin-helix protein with protein kinase domain